MTLWLFCLMVIKMKINKPRPFSLHNNAPLRIESGVFGNLNPRARLHLDPGILHEPKRENRFLFTFPEVLNIPSWLELQTTGVLLNDLNFELLRLMGVSTISLSNFNIFDDKINFEVMDIPEILHYDLKAKCHHIKSLGFNLRICLNMMNWYEDVTLEQIFDRLVELNVDQVTFRKLYTSDIKSPINEYVCKMAMNNGALQILTDLIECYGKPLEILPFGSQKFSYRGISTVVDQDCMATNSNKVIRYLILRENCKLYSRWGLKSSLIF